LIDVDCVQSLVENMIKLDPKERFSAEECLEHPKKGKHANGVETYCLSRSALTIDATLYFRSISHLFSISIFIPRRIQVLDSEQRQNLRLNELQKETKGFLQSTMNSTQ